MALTDFYLIGHSFGGHMMGHFAVRNHQHIKRLLLSSPAGIIQRPEDYKPKKYFEKGMMNPKTGKIV